jgi:hypothetical protein
MLMRFHLLNGKTVHKTRSPDINRTSTTLLKAISPRLKQLPSAAHDDAINFYFEQDFWWKQ